MTKDRSELDGFADEVRATLHSFAPQEPPAGLLDRVVPSVHPIRSAPQARKWAVIGLVAAVVAVIAIASSVTLGG